MKRRYLTALITVCCILGAKAQPGQADRTPRNRRVLLEEYTGIHCGNCPDGHRMANEIVDKHPQEVFVLNIHGSSLAVPVRDEVDLRTPYGEALLEQAGVIGIPSGSVNRHVFSPNTQTVLMRDFWEERIEQTLAMPTYVNIAAKATLDWKSREVSVSVQLYYTGTPSAESNFIHVAVVQDSIVGFQNGSSMNPAQITPDKQYLHMHALRDFLTGQWGEEIKTPQAGSLIEKTFTATLPQTIGNVGVELFDLQFIAFVSEGREEILDVCRAQTENINLSPRIVLLSEPEQIANPSCDKEVRFSLLLKNHYLSTEPISEIVLQSSGKAGKVQHTYTFDSALSVGESLRFETQGIALGKSNRKEDVVFNILSVNGKECLNRKEAISGSALKHYGISQTPQIKLELQQDRFGSDITWTLKNADNDIVAQDGPYQNLSANEELPIHTYPITITEGCHTFTVYDKHRDGINNGTSGGFIRFSEQNGSLLTEHDGIYKDSAVIMLCIGEPEPDTPDEPDDPEDPDDPDDPDDPEEPVDTLSVKYEKAPVLHLYPNPCKDVLYVQLPHSGESMLLVRIFSLDGTEVLRLRKNISQINVSELPAGLYLLEVRTTRGVYRAKIQRR